MSQNTEQIRRSITDLRMRPMPEMPKHWAPERKIIPGDEPPLRDARQQAIADAFDIGGQKMDFLAEQNCVLNANVATGFEAVKMVAAEAAAARDRADAAHLKADTVNTRLDDLEAAPRKFAGKIVAKAGTLILVGILCALAGAWIKKHTGLEIPLVDK